MIISQEVQEIVISSLMKDSYLLSIARHELNEGYFESPACKIIYKALNRYFDKYDALPTEKELIVGIDECYTTSLGITKDLAVSTAKILFNSPQYDEEFVKDRLTDIVRKIRSSKALQSFITKVNNKETLDNDDLVREMTESLEVSFSESKIYNLSDIQNISTIRNSAVGSSTDNKIIQSSVPSINTALQYGGWQPATINMIIAAPGCFTGDTRIMTIDGESHSLEELYNNKVAPGIYGSDKLGNIKTGLSQEVYLSDYTDDLVEVEIDGKYLIKCTPDHPFMTRSGEYKKAEDLVEYDELMPIKRTLRGRLSNGEGSKYESVENGDGNWWFTHQLSAETIHHPEGYSVIHHKDRNKVNNYPSNLEWIKNSKEHLRQHYLNGDFESFIESGKPTRYTSEQIRDRNLENWKSPEYRAKMRDVSVRNGKNSLMTTKLNYSKEFQYKTQQGKILSFINRLLIEFSLDDIREDEYDFIASKSKAKRKVRMSGIRKYFDEDFSSIVSRAKSYNHKVTRVKRLHLEEKVPVYGIVDAKPFGNYAIALSNEEGIFVSNTGKSMFLFNDGAAAAKQGFSVLHILIGDLVEYDGFIRYLSLISGTPQNDLIMMNTTQQANIVNYCNQQYNNVLTRIDLLAYPAETITVDELEENIKRTERQLNKDYNMIIIDYPDNLKKSNSSSMYEEGGAMYASLERMSRLFKATLLVASQPKQCYWSDEILPLESAGESSRKQHAADTIITMGLVGKDAKVGTMSIVKTRRGQKKRVIRFKTAFEVCKLIEIDENEYNVLATNYKSGSA